MGGNMRSLCWRKVVFFGCQTETSTIWGFSAMLPPCSLETVHVEVGEVSMMTCQSIEVLEWVKVLDNIDPYPSTIIHQTEMALRGEISSYPKPTLTQKKVTSKRKGTSTKQWFSSPSIISSADFQEFLVSKNVELFLWSQHLWRHVLCATRSPTVDPSCPGLPAVLKLSKAETAEDFFLAKLWGWESMISCDQLGGVKLPSCISIPCLFEEKSPQKARK